MDDEDAHETLGSMLAKLDGLEKCLGVLGKAVIDNLPKAGPDVIGGFETFAAQARQRNCHEAEIDLYDRMAEWFRRDADLRLGKAPRTGPKPRRK